MRIEKDTKKLKKGGEKVDRENNLPDR